MPPADHSLVHDVARLGPHERVRTALGGVVPAAFAIPLLLNDWSPLWFAAAWPAVYLLISGTSMSLIWFRGASGQVEVWWAVGVALCFAALPVSAVIWNDGRAFWMPAGFAHGFCTLTDDTVVTYKVTDFYAPDAERSIRFDDPDLGIDWPVDRAPSSLGPQMERCAV